MKRIICFLIAAISLTSFAGSKITKVEDIPVEDRALIDLAVMKHDSGDYDGAIKDYDALIKKYPDFLALRYERAYSLYAAKRFDDAAKACRDITKKKGCDWSVYVMWGSILDDAGDPNEAIKVYTKGIKRFPDAGRLYLEGGTTYLRYGYNEDALRWYNNAIEVEPTLSSAYYRAATLYGDSPDKVWALVYAESFLLLDYDNDQRRNEMARLITKIYKENVRCDSTSVNVTLAPAKAMTIIGEHDIEKANVMLGFPGVYEGAIGSSLVPYCLKGETIDSISINNVKTLAQIRRNAVENYYRVSDNIFSDSMYLLEYQKRIIDAGVWEPYNYFIFAAVFPDEASEYLDNHPDEIDQFAAWLEKNPFILDKEHTVGILSIIKNQHLVTIMEALRIQSGFLSNKKPDGTGDTDDADTHD